MFDDYSSVGLIVPGMRLTNPFYQFDDNTESLTELQPGKIQQYSGNVVPEQSSDLDCNVC